MSDTNKLYEALAKFQEEVKDPPRTKPVNQGKFSFKYAELPTILEITRPLLAKHGLCTISTTEIREGQLVLITTLAHVSGQTIKSEYPVCAINNKHQEMGASLTYARRYNYSTVTGIASVDDLDGSNAAPAATGDHKQMSAIEARAEVNWEAIQNKIWEAATEKQLDSRLKSAKARKGIWPHSYYVNALEEIAKRRAELRDGNRIIPTDNQSLFAKLDNCTKVEDVNRVHSLYEQLGYNMEDIADEFEAKIVEIEDKQREPV